VRDLGERHRAELVDEFAVNLRGLEVEACEVRRTPMASTSSTGIEPAGNSATWRRVPASCNSTVLRHASRWLALISPRYSTWRCTTRPSPQRRFSTTLQ
jgi:hypothetical protein